ncbi:EF-hand [Ceraceosorus guamensis]|uniref:EF-hand n=1 Tax=Ceraceosorus guamensis TaxID=1522189 RepID=A0A316VSS0_9BASI|nr:EF-hand [Ceraceosorus guamensis]PWN40532.1 EF-hand [Ceraceosorus guamensis]
MSSSGPPGATLLQAGTRARGTSTRHPRQSSGVYSTFSAKQIHGFREAFSMLDDSSSDGFLDANDLKRVLGDLGMRNEEEDVRKLLSSANTDAQGRINFTQFLTMFGEHLDEEISAHIQLDEASDLLSAFECFDERDEGSIESGELRYWLAEVGNKMTDEEIDRLISGPFLDRAGRKFDYKACE